MTLAQTNNNTGNGKTGSVGAVWPPRFDQHNSRIKGFCLCLISDTRKLSAMLNVVKAVENSERGHSRTTIRAFVKKNLLLEGLDTSVERDVQYDIEAAVSVDNVLPGYAMVYLGKNAPERMSDNKILQMELSSLNAIQTIHAVDKTEAMDRISKKGYSLSSLDGNPDADISRILSLYREAYTLYTFDITQETISGMLNNGNIVIVGRDKHGEIVSSLIAEYCELELEHGRLLHLFELSDYATFRDHRGNGLITAMQIDAVNAIRRLFGPEAIIYAEDRAAWPAVNRSSQKAGMVYCGTLPQHCILVSDRSFGEQGVYENLNVWADLHF